ncbi:MAG: peptidoglycan DD-metalloendopeptidase family protein [Anaerolineales bacterium]
MTDQTSSAPPTMEAPAYRNWRFWAGCLLSLAVLAAVGYWAWTALNTTPIILANPTPPVSAAISQAGNGDSPIPTVVSESSYAGKINRFVDPHTDIPERGASWVTEYIVQQGDTLSGIAARFDLRWESILFGNTEALKDDPNFLKPGQVLYILPVDGMFYKWESKDSLESVAAEYNTTVEAIVDWPGNGINPMDPVITPGTWVILPGGSRPFTWEAPMIANGSTRTFALGPGTCPGKYNGTPGGEPWAWPTTNHNLSGYDFGPAHPGIDIWLYMGQPIYSAQAGVVVFAGWSDRGYGELVIVDHLNGWHTFYAHLSQWNVSCGQQVYTGTLVGLGGSTGNSTGPHLHFEIRYNGVGQNPWGLLP